MRKEGARALRPEDLPEPENMDVRKASEATVEVTQEIDRRSTWKIGEQVSVLKGSGEIKSYEDGIYTVEVDGREMEITSEGLRISELENSLYNTMTGSLDALQDTEGLSNEKKNRIEFALEDLVMALAVSSGSEGELQNDLQTAMMEMVQAPYGEDLNAAWDMIREYSAKLTEVTKTDLIALDYEDKDVEELVTEIDASVENLAEAKIDGDSEASAEHGAILFETVAEVALQLKEEGMSAPPEMKLQISNALNKFTSPLSLGARGVREVAAELSEEMTDVSVGIFSRLKNKVDLDKLQDRFAKLSDRFKTGFAAGLAMAREAMPQAPEQIEPESELMEADPERFAAAPPTRKARPQRSAPRTATAGYGVSMGGAPSYGSSPDYGNIQGGTYSPEQKAEAVEFAAEERSVSKDIIVRMDRVTNFLNSESGRLSILGDPSLSELSSLSADHYKNQQDLAIAGSFWKRRGARKEIKRIDGMMQRAELSMESVGHAPIGGVDIPKAAGAGYSVSMGGSSNYEGRNRDASYYRERARRMDEAGPLEGELFDPDQKFSDEPTGELLDAPSGGVDTTVRRVRPGPGRRPEPSVASAGYGVRMDVAQRSSLGTEKARPPGTEKPTGELLDADQVFKEGEELDIDDQPSGELLPPTNAPTPTHRARPGLGRREIPRSVSPYSVSMGTVARPRNVLPTRRRQRQRPPTPPPAV